MRFFTSNFFPMNWPDSTAKNMPKIAELKLSSCGLEVADFRKNCDCEIAELQLGSNISLKVAELRLRKCFLQVAELRLRTQKKVASAHHCPLHSLTGSVVQPFASHLGGQLFVLRGCTNSQWNWVSPVIVVSLHWWPGTPTWLITGLALGSAPTMGSFTRVRADDVKSQLWSHIAFPSSILLLAGPPPSCNTVTG
jgi:hypothetical protein